MTAMTIDSKVVSARNAGKLRGDQRYKFQKWFDANVTQAALLASKHSARSLAELASTELGVLVSHRMVEKMLEYAGLKTRVAITKAENKAGRGKSKGSFIAKNAYSRLGELERQVAFLYKQFDLAIPPIRQEQFVPVDPSSRLLTYIG